MDFEFDPLPEGFGATVEELVNDELAAARPIEVSFLPRETAVEDEDLIRTKVNMIPESVHGDPRRRHRRARQAGRRRHPRALHRRGRPHPGREDRVEGQGQQAHPDRGRRCVTWPCRRDGCADARTAVVVAFSGGADSAFLAVGRPRHARADRALAVTAVSPSLAPRERDDCRALAEEWGLRWTSRSTPTSWPTPRTAPTTATAASTARTR